MKNIIQVVDSKLGPEELTAIFQIPAEAELANLASDGIVVIGAEVGPNDILVGKIARRGTGVDFRRAFTPRNLWWNREVRDTSLRVPRGEKGIVVDVQMLDREGDELEAGVIKKVIVKVAQIRKVTVGDKVAGRHGIKELYPRILPVADMPYLADGTSVDIIISPLSVLSRYEPWAVDGGAFGLGNSTSGEKAAPSYFCDKLGEDTLSEELKKAGLRVTGKARLYDGRSGEAFKEDTVVGVACIMKLIHMVEDKTHARSTGPYRLLLNSHWAVKAQMGGQRLGEMEVWALKHTEPPTPYGKCFSIIKSDDVLGRFKAFEAIVKRTDIPEATIPESFRVLVRELNSLGLSIEPKGVSPADEGSVLEGEELAKAAGAEIIATDELIAKRRHNGNCRSSTTQLIWTGTNCYKRP